ALVRLSFRRRRWREATLNGICVLIAPDVGPAVIGAARPRVVIPSWSLSLDDQSRSLMLRHEAEHIAARDPLLLLLAAWSLILFSALLAAAMLTACVAASSIPRPRSLRATALRRVATERLQLPTAVRQKIAATTRSSLGIASRRYQPRPEGSMRPVPAPVAAESLGRAVSGVVTAAGRDTPVRNAE